MHVLSSIIHVNFYLFFINQVLGLAGLPSTVNYLKKKKTLSHKLRDQLRKKINTQLYITILIGMVDFSFLHVRTPRTYNIVLQENKLTQMFCKFFQLFVITFYRIYNLYISTIYIYIYYGTFAIHNDNQIMNNRKIITNDKKIMTVTSYNYCIVFLFGGWQLLS